MKSKLRLVFFTALICSYIIMTMSLVNAEAQEDLWEKLYTQADVLSKQMQYGKAMKMAKESIVLAEKIFGSDDIRVTKPLSLLGSLYRSYFYSEIDKAEFCFHRVLVIKRKILGPYHQEVTGAVNNLAMSYVMNNKSDDAERLYKEDLSDRERVYGVNHHNTVESLNNLAHFYDLFRKKNKKEAELLFKKALEIREKTLPPDNLNIAKSLSNLAIFYHGTGDYKKAEQYYINALELMKNSGSDIEDICLTTRNLATVYYTWGKYEKAEELYKQSLDMKEKEFGQENPKIMDDLNNLANYYKYRRKYKDAEIFYKKALEICKKAFGPEDFRVADAINELASLYNDMRKYNEIENLYKEALKIREKNFDPDHWYVKEALKNLASHYLYNIKRYDDAELLYKKAIEIDKKIRGPDHPGLIWTYGCLIDACNKTGKKDEVVLYENEIKRIEQIEKAEEEKITAKFHKENKKEEKKTISIDKQESGRKSMLSVRRGR